MPHQAAEAAKAGGKAREPVAVKAAAGVAAVERGKGGVRSAAARQAPACARSAGTANRTSAGFPVFKRPAPNAAPP